MKKLALRPKDKSGDIRFDIQSGFAIALFFLWLPILFQNALSGIDSASPLNYARGALEVLAVVAGFALMLLLDRFIPKSTQGVRQFCASAGLMALTVASSFIVFSVLAAVAVMFAGAALVAILVLPLIKELRGIDGTVRVFFSAVGFGGGLGVTVMPLLRIAHMGMADEYPLLEAAVSGLLLTCGLYMSRHLLRQQTSAPVVNVWKSSPKRPLMALYCLAALLACVGILFLGAELHASKMRELEGIHTHIILILTGSVVIMSFLYKKSKFMLSYVTSFCGSMAGLLMLSGLQGAVVDYITLFFLINAFVSLFMLLMLFSCFIVAPVNYIFVHGLGGAVLFAQLWLLINPQNIGRLGHYLNNSLAVASLLAGIYLLSSLLIKPANEYNIRHQDTEEEEEAPKEVPVVISKITKSENLLPEEPDTDALYTHLTMTEKKVYELILSGYSNQQMADLMFVSINTIKFHIKNILAKAGATKKSQLLSRHIAPLSHGDAI